MDLLLFGESSRPTTTFVMLALGQNKSNRQGRTCPLSASVRLKQIALRGLAPMEKYQGCES